jgi:threonine dehydrogenase-like Zn-dependent dehydrogenase
MISYPRVPGHEISGIVDSVGENVPSPVRTGMEATVYPYTNCGRCSACLSGRYNACKNNETLGVQRDGASCEFIIVPWEKLVFAEGLSLDELVLVEPISVGFHAIDRARVKENDYVAVYGAGMIGLGAIMGAAVKTSNVIAIDIADGKLDLANRVGAKYLIHSASMDVHQKLNVITNGHGPSVVIEAVGLPETYRDAVQEVSFTGRVVYIGYAKKQVEYESRLFVMKELDIMGSRNANPDDFSKVTEYMRRGLFDPEIFITDRIRFEDLGNALEKWSDDPATVTKLVVDMERSFNG